MTREVKNSGLDAGIWEVKTYNDDQLELSLGDLLWETLWGCKNGEDFLRLKQKVRNDRRSLTKVRHGEEGTPSLMEVHSFGARMFALGLIRGMQQGTLLGSGSKGSATTEPMLQYPSVVKLLLREPVVSSLEVCEVLDKVKANLPWPKFAKKSKYWIDHARNPSVKAAISNARTDARQSAIDKRFLSLVKSIGDAGSIFDDDLFNVKKRAVAGKRK
jgi:hypothetical protein